MRSNSPDMGTTLASSTRSTSPEINEIKQSLKTVISHMRDPQEVDKGSGEQVRAGN